MKLKIHHISTKRTNVKYFKYSECKLCCNEMIRRFENEIIFDIESGKMKIANTDMFINFCPFCQNKIEIEKA